MAESSKLTKEEILDLKLKLKELEILFEKNINEFILFKESPMRYLRSKNIKALKHIRNKKDNLLLFSLYGILRNITRQMDFFDRCSWCKITALLTIYSILGKAGYTVHYASGLIGYIIEVIKEILNLNNVAVRSLTDFLKSIKENLSPFRIAKIICEQMGFCSSQNLIVNN
jgi:hypothetical protein